MGDADQIAGLAAELNGLTGSFSQLSAELAAMRTPNGGGGAAAAQHPPASLPRPRAMSPDRLHIAVRLSALLGKVPPPSLLGALRCTQPVSGRERSKGST